MDARPRRVLLTRPEPGLGRTSAILRARGFEPVALPLSEIVARPAEVPDRDIVGYVATSAAAIAGAGQAIDPLLPFFAVGSATASAAAGIGCRDVRTGPGDAAGLAQVILRSDIGDKGSLLYLAGEPRKSDLEDTLATAGVALRVITVYAAVAIEPSRDGLVETIGPGLGACLFYSPATAERFCAVVEKHGLEKEFGTVPMLGLSRQVIEPFLERAWVRDTIDSAPIPEEESLLALLETIRNKAG